MEVSGDKHTEQETKDQDKVNGCGSPDLQMKNEANNDSANCNGDQESNKLLNEHSENSKWLTKSHLMMEIFESERCIVGFLIFHMNVLNLILIFANDTNYCAYQ